MSRTALNSFQRRFKRRWKRLRGCCLPVKQKSEAPLRESGACVPKISFFEITLARSTEIVLHFFPFRPQGGMTDIPHGRVAACCDRAPCWGLRRMKCVGADHPKDASIRHCLRAVRLLRCIFQGIPTRLIRCIGGGVIFPRTFSAIWFWRVRRACRSRERVTSVKSERKRR